MTQTWTTSELQELAGGGFTINSGWLMVAIGARLFGRDDKHSDWFEYLPEEA